MIVGDPARLAGAGLWRAYAGVDRPASAAATYTAEDVGTSVADMAACAGRRPTCWPPDGRAGGWAVDPSPHDRARGGRRRPRRLGGGDRRRGARGGERRRPGCRQGRGGRWPACSAEGGARVSVSDVTGAGRPRGGPGTGAADRPPDEALTAVRRAGALRAGRRATPGERRRAALPLGGGLGQQPALPRRGGRPLAERASATCRTSWPTRAG